jgi:hypothetical protein
MRKTSLWYAALGLFLFFITACQQQTPQDANLIVNGDGEIPKYDTIPPGWQNIQGHWVSYEEDSVKHDFAYSQHGKYLFFAGNDSLGILQQDIDLSKYARSIDAGKQQFIFNGYVESLDQGPNSDQSAIAITGLDGSKNKALYNFRDTTRSIGKWLEVTDTFMAPPTTRSIRVQMVAIRHVGGDNDGYFDNFSLSTRSLDSDLNWVWIVLVILIIAAGIALMRYRRKVSAARTVRPGAGASR